MTNFEWIWRDNKRSKDLFVHGLAVNERTGEVEKCSTFNCGLCLFNESDNDVDTCHDLAEDWLDMEHEPLYKRGDIIIMGSGDLAFVISESDPGTIVISNNIADLNNGIGVSTNIKYVKQKVGNMLDNCDRKEI